MRLLLSSLLAGVLLSLPLVAQDRPVVVELFTAQGCPACPPADALLRELGTRQDVLPLALHVDYWDYIGWQDSFASPAHTARQRAYAKAGGRRMVYTPQVILNGQDHVVGTRVRDIEALIEHHKAIARDTVTLQLDRTDTRLRIRAERRASPGAPLDVLLMRYRPQAIVQITRGENAGKALRYSHIVTTLRPLAPWPPGAPLDRAMTVTGDAPVVVLIQQPGHGPVMAAARLR